MATLKLKDGTGKWITVQSLKGDRGEQGPQGPKGDDGTGVTILGSYNTLA
jgi:hypothetical protein